MYSKVAHYCNDERTCPTSPAGLNRKHDSAVGDPADAESSTGYLHGKWVGKVAFSSVSSTSIATKALSPPST